MLRKLLCLTICVLAGAVGCSGGTKVVMPENPAPVTGVVTLDGKPLDNARVVFFATEKTQGECVSGTTDSTGKYELSGVFGDQIVQGAASGKYRVVISRFAAPDGTPITPDASEPPMMTGARESLPLKVSDYASTTLSANVASSGGTFNFDVRSR